jgi:hypothetical protein
VLRYSRDYSRVVAQGVREAGGLERGGTSRHRHWCYSVGFLFPSPLGSERCPFLRLMHVSWKSTTFGNPSTVQGRGGVGHWSTL